MTDVKRPQFSDDPRGGVYIDDGVTPITRVEDETPAPDPTPAEKPAEVVTDV